MRHDQIAEDYFAWLYNTACENRFSKKVSFRKLLRCLHDIEFIYLIPRDENRAEDGKDLRHRFSYDYTCLESADLYLEGPCSVLEMILALAIKIEEETMDNTDYGDRTGQWFWKMIVNLGLGSMSDERFDRRRVIEIIDKRYFTKPNYVNWNEVSIDCNNNSFVIYAVNNINEKCTTNRR